MTSLFFCRQVVRKILRHSLARIKTSKNLLSICASLLLLVTTSPFAAEQNGAPFAVTGEQLEHPVPKGWKLAWMHEAPSDGYFAEYIPETEEIASWREGYLLIRRIPYPPAEVLKEIENSKATLAGIALIEFFKSAREGCQGKHIPMMQRTNTFNDVFFAVGGGFCDEYGPAAPFGEGALVAYAHGKKYLFQIQYGWRPKSTQDAQKNLPWRIAPELSKAYLEAIKASSLCGGIDQPMCKSNYLP